MAPPLRVLGTTPWDALVKPIWPQSLQNPEFPEIVTMIKADMDDVRDDAIAIYQSMGK